MAEEEKLSVSVDHLRNSIRMVLTTISTLIGKRAAIKIKAFKI